MTTRRDFLKLAATGAAGALLSGPGRSLGQETASRLGVPRGYLIVQDLKTYHASRFASISTRAEAEEIFAALEGRLDALEFASTFLDEKDLLAHEAVARVGAAHAVDLWTSTYGLPRKIRAFGEIPPAFQAHVLQASGRIVPATVKQADGTPMPMFDVLNPEAMDWLLEALQHRYFARMKGLLSGIFFNEDCLPYVGEEAHDRRFDYWRNATFSPRVLELWRAYCRAHDVRQGGRLVDRFPVHTKKMAVAGGGRTMHVPGWNVPSMVRPGERFARLPRVRGVWKHWTDFTCDVFLENWIGRIARLAHEVNAGEAAWKGALYFGLHSWSLPYEQVASTRLKVPQVARWGAWGRQRGIDLERLAAHPALDALVCETYPPIEANLEGFVAEFARIARDAGKPFGLMVHRDDTWGLEPAEETRRWELIADYRPTLLVRYPRRLMTPGDEHYNARAEQQFAARLRKYRKSG